MNHVSFSEDALRQAAALVRQSMLDSMPFPSQCTHEFSPGFQGKMERLISREWRRGSARKAMKRVAMFFLAVLVSAGAWLSVDSEARAAFTTWVRHVYESSVVYRFYGEPAAEALPAYRITWLPEGYEILDVFDNGNVFNAFYQQGDDVMTGFVFEYFFAQDSSLAELLFFDEGDYNYKTIDVNGVQADFYEALLPGETNFLIWFDESTNIVFIINGFPKESVIVHIAQSVLLTNLTK